MVRQNEIRAANDSEDLVDRTGQSVITYWKGIITGELILLEESCDR